MSLDERSEGEWVKRFRQDFGDGGECWVTGLTRKRKERAESLRFSDPGRNENLMNEIRKERVD